MKNIYLKLKQFALKLIALAPSRLPTTKDEFESFTKSIFDLYQFPDCQSYRHAIASMIMHMGTDATHASKASFAKSIYKAQTNQVCFHVLEAIREEEKKQREAQPELIANADGNGAASPDAVPKEPIQN